jgi:hypothetical protein
MRGIILTLDGLKGDEKGHALKEDRKTVAGWWVANEVVRGLHYPIYPGGCGLIEGASFRRLTTRLRSWCQRTRKRGNTPGSTCIWGTRSVVCKTRSAILLLVVVDQAQRGLLFINDPQRLTSWIGTSGELAERYHLNGSS